MRVADAWPAGLGPGERCTEVVGLGGWWELTATSRGVPDIVADLARAGGCTLAIERSVFEVAPGEYRVSDYANWHAEGWS